MSRFGSLILNKQSRVDQTVRTTQIIVSKRRMMPTAFQSVLVFVLLFLSGCAYQNYNIPRDSYTLSNRFYTFAIYNDAGRLLTHPLLDLERALETASVDGHGCNRITDIYVISHGWNYSATEAVPNYHNYIELLDRFQQQNRQSETPESFCPYLIFVSWTSTTRPLEDLASGILPFNLDEAIRPVGAFIDKVVLHPLTAWKQSFHATTIALGARYPNYYLTRPWYEHGSPLGYQEMKLYGTESPYFVDKDTGYDAPLSAMLYELIQWKTSPEENRPSLKSIDLHLIGHSYGAKLVTLAGMEALRRWILIDHLLDKPDKQSGDKTRDKRVHETNLLRLRNVINRKPTTKISEDSHKSRAHHEETRENDSQTILSELGQAAVQAVSEVADQSGLKVVSELGLKGLSQLGVPWPEDYDAMSKRWEAMLSDTGHRDSIYMPIPFGLRKGIVELLQGTPEGGKGFDDIQNKETPPIASLVLINPAMHPGELWYPVGRTDGEGRTAPVRTLEQISRKAILYSKYDHTNGVLFNLREALFPVQQLQKIAVHLDDVTTGTFFNENERKHPFIRTIVPPLPIMFAGSFALVNGVVQGVSFYVGTLLANLPFDLWYHIQHNQMQVDGMPNWLKWDAPRDNVSPESFIARAVNLVDFFVPRLPIGPVRDEPFQGILRLSRPAVGKTGVEQLVAGRPKFPNLYGLTPAYISGYTPDIDADKFCSYLEGSYDKGPMKEAQSHSNMRKAIYSFNASNVYNSSLPLIGAHDEVRSRENDTSCPLSSDSSERKHLSIMNGLLAEVKTRATKVLKTCPNNKSEDTETICRENQEALDSLELVDINKDGIYTVAVSGTPFQGSHRGFSAIEARIHEFWDEIEAPLTTQLADEHKTRLGFSPSLKLTHTRKKEKRELSFDFVYRFTKGYLDRNLLETFPKP
jgi:hypothetical protein